MEEIIMPNINRIKVFFRPLSVKILSVIIAVLLIVVTCLSIVLVKKHNKAVAVGAKISQTEDMLEKANDEIGKIKEQLKTEQNSNSDLQNKLAEKETEKQQLEEQIKALQSEMEMLKLSAGEPKPSPIINAVVPPPVVTYPTIPVPISNSGSRVCYLTFDDGPSRNTLRIIDILNQYGVNATFFVTCTGKTEYMHNIVASGNAIGLHTASHDYSSIYANDAAYFSDLAYVSNVVKNQTGVDSFIIRFPGGSSNRIGNKYCTDIMKRLVVSTVQSGYQYFDWNVDSGDASKNNPSAEYIMNNIKNEVGNKQSVCILMHDTAAKNGTVEALPQMIEWLYLNGFRFEVLTPSTEGFHHNIG